MRVEILLKEVATMDGAYISAFNILQNMSRNDVEVCHYCDAATFGVPPHRHDFYELYCILSDSYTYHVEGSKYEIRPGSLILVPLQAGCWPETLTRVFTGPGPLRRPDNPFWYSYDHTL